MNTVTDLLKDLWDKRCVKLQHSARNFTGTYAKVSKVSWAELATVTMPLLGPLLAERAVLRSHVTE